MQYLIYAYHDCIVKRCTTILVQGPQRIIFSAPEGRRQIYELNFRWFSIKT